MIRGFLLPFILEVYRPECRAEAEGSFEHSPPAASTRLANVLLSVSNAYLALAPARSPFVGRAPREREDRQRKRSIDEPLKDTGPSLR